MGFDQQIAYNNGITQRWSAALPLTTSRYKERKMADRDCISRRDWTNARSNAKRRNIPFDLTYEQWSDVWRLSGKWHERGRRTGQYQMDRKDNASGYSPGNIQIVVGAVNRTKDSPHGWTAKLREGDVLDIRQNFKKHVRGWRYFAAKYGVSVATIKAVRTGRNWQ
jgi:hypothetical protein